MALRGTALSFQVSDAELPALEVVLAALERENAHLRVVAASGEVVDLSPTLEGGLRDLLRLLVARHP